MDNPESICQSQFGAKRSKEHTNILLASGSWEGGGESQLGITGRRQKIIKIEMSQEGDDSPE